MEVDELYQDLLLDHFKNPRCQGCVSKPDACMCLHNPLCGDRIELGITFRDDKIEDIKFAGQGCSISQASASMMSELCKGKSIEELEQLAALFRAMMKGEKSGVEINELGDAMALEGVRKFAARLRCALLAWEALEKCIVQVKGKARSGARLLEVLPTH